MDENFRSFSLPIDHLVAEVSAYPIATESSFRLGLIQLNGRFDDARSRQLWREAENSLLKSNPSISVDELVGIRDRIWFSNSKFQDNTPIPLSSYVHGLAERSLHLHQESLPSDAQSNNHKMTAPRFRQAWRWMKFALPSDLISGALSKNGLNGSVPKLISPKLETKLRDQGFAESHFHIGAGVEFPILWIAVQYFLASSTAKADSFSSPGACFNAVSYTHLTLPTKRIV